jgi:hypothetical protein
MRAKIKIRFIETVSDPDVHYTLDQVYQVLSLGGAAPVSYIVLNDIDVIQAIQVTDTRFELVLIIIPGDDVQLYP